MNKLLCMGLALLMATSALAADAIYRGDSKDAKDVVAYFKGGAFYKDEACKELLFHHPGNMVAKEKPANAKNAIFRLMGGRIYKGFSIKPEDCIATIVVSKSVKGNAAEAKVYKGFAIAREDKRESGGPGIELLTYTITKDGKLPEDGMEPEPIDVLFTIKDGKIYEGDSTDKCVLTMAGDFNAARILFICAQFLGLAPVQ